jgi:hypothetical protein
MWVAARSENALACSGVAAIADPGWTSALETASADAAKTIVHCLRPMTRFLDQGQ